MSTFGSLEANSSTVRQRTKGVRAVVPIGKVDGVRVMHTSSPLWLLLAAMAAMGGAYLEVNGGGGLMPCLALAAFLVLGFVLSRRAMLMVHAGNVVLQTSIRGKPDEAYAFMAEIMDAQRRRQRPH